MNNILAEVEESLREHGVRVTEPRRVIVEALLRTDGHFTADEVLARMRSRGRSVSKATLYRTLSLLVECGHLEPREFERGSLRYEVVTGRDHHDHMICTGCGTVHEFVDHEIERL
ncbi:MAG: Fur family transcriptional regulator, partial [Planctomycetota bacterium]